MIAPKKPIRRFDVFAEYNRLKALAQGRSPREAKAYGIWLAKVVAARKFSKSRKQEGEKETGKKKEPEKLVDNKWHELEDVPQTDALFDKEIIQRMGPDFYQKVFSPAIEKAYESGQDYMEIRDSIREDWKPEKK